MEQNEFYAFGLIFHERVTASMAELRIRGETPDAEREAAALRLRQLRSVLTGNQSEVARLCGVSVTAWGRYERGERQIELVVLAQFCRVFNVSADWVVLGDLYCLPKQVIAALAAAYPNVLLEQPAE